MKTREELNALREEVEAVNRKLRELSEEELEQVTGGLIPPYPPLKLTYGTIGGVVSPNDIDAIFPRNP